MAIDINSLTKRYADPWATSFEYLDPTGMLLGTGYDSYQDAIRKLSFKSGATYQAPVAASSYWEGGASDGTMVNDPGSAGGWSYSTPRYDGYSIDYGTDGQQIGSGFATEQALYDYLLSQPGNPISYDSSEKYGRQLTEGQLQNMYAQYASGNLVGGVPDWTYHRFAYEPAHNPSEGMQISGKNALIGSTPIFGEDGKISGYKINANPEHINGDDTSGRVTGGSHGATTLDPNLMQYAKNLGDGNVFISAADADKYWYKSYGSSTYNKEESTFSKLAEGLVKSGLMSAVGMAGGAALGGMFGDVAAATTGGIGESAALGSTGAAAGSGGTGMFDWLSDAGSWVSDLFGGGGTGAQALDPSILGGDAIETMWKISEAQGGIPWTEAASNLGFNSVTSLLGSIDPSWVSTGLSNPTSSAGKLLQSLGAVKADGSLNPQVLSGILSAGGGLLTGNAATDAAQAAANAQLEAARIAADAAKFKPVGVTTRFGQSNFTKDAQGNVTDAGYTMPNDIRAMQDSLLGAAPGMLSQFTGSQAATAPMGEAAQRMMQLGNGYLSTDPQAQAKKYYDDQQAIMAAGRARDQAGALTGEFNRGTYGLATGATGMMGAANPRLEAMYNAQRQQDLQAAANATQGGMDYAKFGSTMTGLGGDMLKSMYGTQTAAYNPYATAMGGAQTIEGLGQNALDLSVNMGKVASPAQSGQLLGQGMLGAANTMQQANQYSPWGTALMSAGNALNTMQQPQQQQTSGYMFNPFTGVRL